MGKKKRGYRVLVGKPGGRRTSERPRRTWMLNYLKGAAYENQDWISLRIGTNCRLLCTRF
jgi:hypothetical protein